MIFEIINTILLLFSLLLNIKILNITHNIQNKNKIQNPNVTLDDISTDISTDIMSCDNCEAANSYDSITGNKKNNVSIQNIYTLRADNENENDNVKLLGNQTEQQGEAKEWTEIQINK